MDERRYSYEDYLKLHNSCGLKVGDKVKVLRSAKDYEQGWANGWMPKMDEFIGLDFIITADDFMGGFVLSTPDPDCFPFNFPCFVLRKVEEQNTTPSYYGGKENLYEAIKVIQAWELGFELGNVLKYISRAGKKTPDALSDLRKAAEYLQYEIQKREKK